MILEEDNPGPVAAVETKTIYTNAISAIAADNSGITNNTEVYNYSKHPTLIFTINPTPDVEPDDEHEASEDDDNDENYDDDDEIFEEVYSPEEDTPDPISIESDDKERNNE